MLTIPNEIVPLQIARGALRVPSAALAGLRAVLCAIPDIKGITMAFAPPAPSVVATLRWCRWPYFPWFLWRPSATPPGTH